MATPQALPARAACVGAGVIGAGWAARFALMGVEVTVHDPHPQAESQARAALASAERAYRQVAGARRPRPAAVRFVASIAEAVADADFVQESVPERLDLKRSVLAEIDAHAGAAVPIASSTSGLLPSDMQAGLRHPGRLLVGHPFNPVYLLPLVELVGGGQTEPAIIARAADAYRALGMQPLTLEREIDAFVGDRLQEALWREALWLVHDGIATVSDIDDVIRYSFGLRWAQMGVFQVYRVAGGEAGMRHFMAQFGPALKWPWTKLMDVPDMDDALLDRICEQSDVQAGGLGIRELERIRDDNLVRIMDALAPAGHAAGWGAGASQQRLRALLAARAEADAAGSTAADDGEAGLGTCLHRSEVPRDWLDYNGHMTEHRYVQVFGETTDALLARIGVDAGYVAAGRSYHTVESHVRHLAEARAGDRLRVHTRVLEAGSRRLHLFHSMLREDDGTLLATSEQMLLHVDSVAGRSVAASAQVLGALQALAEEHAGLAPPAGSGRRIGMPPH